MSDEPATTDDLVRRAAGGEELALAELFASYRDRLRRMVRLRLDRRLQGRVDPSDVLQEAYLDLARKLPGYATKRPMPFFLWLRLVVAERLLRVHRQHLDAAARDAGREISLNRGTAPQATSASLAVHLLGQATSVSRAAIRVERQARLQVLLNAMDQVDREVIALRHFEELSNDQVAAVLGLSKAAASKRYVRAMLRLKSVLSDASGMADTTEGGNP